MIGFITVGTDGPDSAAIAFDSGQSSSRSAAAPNLVVLNAYSPAMDLGRQWAATSAIATERLLEDTERTAKEKGSR